MAAEPKREEIARPSEVVGTDVPVTGSGIQRSMEKPKNLDFED